ncbi:NTP transferase domain-containing protein [Candidatus Lokiarchaeum ossiferum]|uniref:NTP transferase domain-containing protein n=1 Tax=Candidatus Lokiarchaeum ossiferum TaxID=2951803 RepID=UPI00352C7279
MEKIDCIIMAGGKASRFDFNQIDQAIKEKPLIQVKKTRLIDVIIKVALNSESLAKIYIATSPHTPKTYQYLKSQNNPKIEILSTPGKDFHSDLKFIIETYNLSNVLILTADLPTIHPSFLNSIVQKFFEEKKPALAVMMDWERAIKNSTIPTDRNNAFIDKYGNKLFSIGINILNGKLIRESFIDQIEYITENVDLLLNINTADDYYRYVSFLDEKKKVDDP